MTPPEFVYIRDYPCSGCEAFGTWDATASVYWLDDGDGYVVESILGLGTLVAFSNHMPSLNRLALEGPK